MGFPVFVYPKNVQDGCFRCPGAQYGQFSPWCIVSPPPWAHPPAAMSSRPTAPCCAVLRRAAPRCAAPLLGRPSRLFAPPCPSARGISRFPDMPCTKKVYRDGKASVHWSAARNKELLSSNAGLVPPLVYIGIRLFVLLERCSFRTCVYDALEGTRDGCIGEPIHRRPVLHGMALPRPAQRYAAPSRPAPSMSGFWILQIPERALHEKGLQRQKGVVPLVGSQEHRALLVPVMNQ